MRCRWIGRCIDRWPWCIIWWDSSSWCSRLIGPYLYLRLVVLGRGGKNVYLIMIMRIGCNCLYVFILDLSCCNVGLDFSSNLLGLYGSIGRSNRIFDRRAYFLVLSLSFPFFIRCIGGHRLTEVRLIFTDILHRVHWNILVLWFFAETINRRFSYRSQGYFWRIILTLVIFCIFSWWFRRIVWQVGVIFLIYFWLPKEVRLFLTFISWV